jgi:predicted Zn-dependent protease with MMP-like domain
MWLSPEEFMAVVEELLSQLPADYLALLDNVVILVEEEPSPEDLEVTGHQPGEELLGLYQGVPFPQRGASFANVLPDRVVLFRGPLLRQARHLRQLKEEILATLIHELGHYFGLQEEQLP